MNFNLIIKYLRLPLLCCIVFSCIGIQAQIILPQDSIPATSLGLVKPLNIYIPHKEQSNDSINEEILKEFFVSKYLRYFDKKGDSAFNIESGIIPKYDNIDSIYQENLANLNSVIKAPYNTKVKNYIDVYVNRNRKQVNVMLILSQYYFPIFESALEANGVPKELKYLAIIESGLNQNAVSRVGASGLWQFMSQTGKIYDLRVDANVDERYDPIKASDAAARYLKYLYNTFGDWTLAIAAYNCGPGAVNKAIRRAKGKTDFWKIYDYLPKETRSYVPAFIGATYVMNYYESHGYFPPDSMMPILTDTLMLNQDISMSNVAKTLNIPLEILRDMNPQYKGDIIPGKSQVFSIRLPVNFITSFIDNQDSLYYSEATENSILDYNNEVVHISYRVKKKDNLSLIAKNFGIDKNDLIKWNHLKTEKLHYKQILAIYLKRKQINQNQSRQLVYQAHNTSPKPGSSNLNSVYFAKTDSLNYPKTISTRDSPKIKSDTTSLRTKSTSPAKSLPRKKTNTSPKVSIKTNVGVNNTGKTGPSSPKDKNIIYYTVKKGDTLYSIIKAHPGSVLEEVISLNALANHGSKIHPNQVLKIKITNN